MVPWTAGDICEYLHWSHTTLAYWRARDFPKPRWTVGGKRSTACWRKADVLAWIRDREDATSYAAGLALLAQLGSVQAAAAHAAVPVRTFRDFLREAGEEAPDTSALRVLKLAESHADERTGKKLRAAYDALSKL